MFGKKFVFFVAAGVCCLAGAQTVPSSDSDKSVKASQPVQNIAPAVALPAASKSASDASLASSAPTIALISQMQKMELEVIAKKRIDLLNAQSPVPVQVIEKASANIFAEKKLPKVISRKINTVLSLYGRVGSETVDVSDFDGKIQSLKAGMRGRGFFISSILPGYLIVEIDTTNKPISAKTKPGKKVVNKKNSQPAVAKVNSEKLVVRVGEAFETY